MRRSGFKCEGAPETIRHHRGHDTQPHRTTFLTDQPSHTFRLIEQSAHQSSHHKGAHGVMESHSPLESLLGHGLTGSCKGPPTSTLSRPRTRGRDGRREIDRPKEQLRGVPTCLKKSGLDFPEGKRAPSLGCVRVHWVDAIIPRLRIALCPISISTGLSAWNPLN